MWVPGFREVLESILLTKVSAMIENTVIFTARKMQQQLLLVATLSSISILSVHTKGQMETIKEYGLIHNPYLKNIT